MATSYKLTTRKDADFRKQRKAFKKCVTEQAMREFLAFCEWLPMEVAQLVTGGKMGWYPTAVGMVVLDAAWPDGFASAEEADAKGQELRAGYVRQLGNTATPAAG